MSFGSFALKMLLICRLCSGSTSTCPKAKVQGTFIKNGKSMVRGVEGKNLTIVCNVQSDKPAEKFVLRIKGSKLKRSGSGNLTYSFIPSQFDNMQSFGFSALSAFLVTPLSCEVLLDIQSDRPEPPTNVSVIPYERHLAVSWCPEYNGGEPQTFFIEYQQEAVEMWTRSGPIIDNTKGRMSNLLYNMSPKRRYFVRVFSRNEIGESNKTAVTPVMTLGGMKKLERICQVEPVDNQLYLSSDDPDLATVHNLRTQSVMNTSLPSNAHDNQTYQIQLHNEDGANDRRPCTYINSGVVSSVHNRQMCETSLNYTEITFDEAPTMHDAAIHGTCGSVNRTIYSEIKTTH